MATLETFHKIKGLRNREKNEFQKEYQQAVKSFEEHATLLYEALKEKEIAESTFEQQLAKQRMQAATFIEHQQYIERLEKRIESLQPTVNEARKVMLETQSNLTEAHVEVKKFEKLIERKQQKQQKILNDEEAKQMDELSIKQYLTFRNR